MFRVTGDDGVTDAVFNHPLGAVSRALTLSMESSVTFRVAVEGVVVCLARGGALLDADGAREVTPVQAVRLAQRLAKGRP